MFKTGEKCNFTNKGSATVNQAEIFRSLYIDIS